MRRDEDSGIRRSVRLQVHQCSKISRCVISNPAPRPTTCGCVTLAWEAPMILVSAAMVALFAAAEKPAVVVHAQDSPVKIGRATVLTVDGDPPVVLYAASNQTADDIEQ